MDNLEEIDTFLETYMTEPRIDNLNRPVSSDEIEFLINYNQTKLKIWLLSCTSHISGAQWPVATVLDSSENGSFPSLQKVLLEIRLQLALRP